MFYLQAQSTPTVSTFQLAQSDIQCHGNTYIHSPVTRAQLHSMDQLPTDQYNPDLSSSMMGKKWFHCFRD